MYLYTSLSLATLFLSEQFHFQPILNNSRNTVLYILIFRIVVSHGKIRELCGLEGESIVSVNQGIKMCWILCYTLISSSRSVTLSPLWMRCFSMCFRTHDTDARIPLGVLSKTRGILACSRDYSPHIVRIPLLVHQENASF
jgi:hypothetical protein